MNQVVLFPHYAFTYLLFLELLPNSKKIKKLKTVLTESQNSVSFKESFQDLDEEDNEAMMGYKLMIFTVDDKKEIVQLLKDFIIKNNDLSSDHQRLTNCNNWFSLFENVKSKPFTEFLNKHIPSYVSYSPKLMTNGFIAS